MWPLIFFLNKKKIFYGNIHILVKLHNLEFFDLEQNLGG